MSVPWWISPGGIALGFLLPMFLLIAAVDEGGFEGLTIRTARFLTAPFVILGAGLILMIAIGGWLGNQLKLAGIGKREPPQIVCERAAMLVATVTFGAYLIFFKDFWLHPVLLLRTLIGAYRPSRATVQATVGITSFTNFAPVVFSIYGYLAWVRRARISLTLHLIFAVLIAFTLFRVYVWSERLALIEALMPLAIAGAVGRRHAADRLARWLMRLGPYAGLMPLILYFGLAESFRSWASPTYHQKIGFWRFVLGRITTYYYTSLNNGAGVLVTTQWPTYKFENTLTWLHRMPVFGKTFSSLVGLRYFEMERFLAAFGDEEFNNPSGLFGVVYDVGIPGAMLYFAMVGFVAALLLRAYQAGSQLAVLLYPMFFLFLLEVFRYPYFGSPRAFTWALGIVTALVVLKIGSPQPERSGFGAQSAF
jgi:hypothetical protein